MKHYIEGTSLGGQPLGAFFEIPEPLVDLADFLKNYTLADWSLFPAKISAAANILGRGDDGTINALSGQVHNSVKTYKAGDMLASELNQKMLGYCNTLRELFGIECINVSAISAVDKAKGYPEK